MELAWEGPAKMAGADELIARDENVAKCTSFTGGADRCEADPSTIEEFSVNHPRIHKAAGSWRRLK